MSTCPNCGGDSGRNLYALTEQDGVAYSARKCGGCGFLFLSPQPTPEFLSRHYAQAAVYGLVSDKPDDYRAVINDKKALFTRLFRPLGILPSGISVDFGASLGVTVKACEEMGFEATGVEISQTARNTAKGLFGFDLKDGGLDQFADNSLSLITLFDVLEHIPDPRAFAEAARKKLKPGGVFLVGVPNYLSLDRMMYGANSQSLFFPEHVNYFTRATLSRVYKEAGYKLDYIGSPPPYAIAITFGLRKRMFRAFGYNSVTRGLRDTLSFLKRYVAYPLPNAFVESTGLLGTSLVAVGRA